MRERSELARKGIARGRSVVALAYADGVLFVAENPSRSLQKVSELYDRVGFAAVGRFNEFDKLRRGGIQFADTRGYAYARRDVTGRQLANVYAQALGTIFTEQAKPYEVELCVAEVAHYGETKAARAVPDHVRRLDRRRAAFRRDGRHHRTDRRGAQRVLHRERKPVGGGQDRDRCVEGRRQRRLEPARSTPSTLEVAILDANRPRRAFRRITGSALEAVLPEEDSPSGENKSDA